MCSTTRDFHLCAGSWTLALSWLSSLSREPAHRNVRESLTETLTRHDDNLLTELSCNKRSRWRMWCCHQKLTRSIWEGPKEGGCQPIVCLVKLTWKNLGRAKRRREETTCPAHLPETLTLESILAERCERHQGGPWVRSNMRHARWLSRDNPETNPITIKPETAGHVAEQFFWVPLPCCSLPGCPFPIKSFAMSVHVSPWTIHLRVLDKSPL